MIIKKMLPPDIRLLLRKTLYGILEKSIESAAKEQGYEDLANRLRKIVPDITHQYSTFMLKTSYEITKVRTQHAFQITCVNTVIDEFDKPVIVDIGDSSGTHLQYLTGLYKNKKMRCLSVNIDLNAVEKIKQKGLEAIHARAEHLGDYDINADIFMCFQVLEHLMDPCHLLHGLSTSTNVQYLIITVPYVRRSRVGLDYIRRGNGDKACAETTHIFELTPEDWKLIAKHSGWSVLEEKYYFQYPQKSFLFITKLLWKWFDFEGFYGMVLRKDNRYSSKYIDW